MAERIGYAVLESSERLGLSSLDHNVFPNKAEAGDHATWCAAHLTGSYADAGDTKCEVVEVSRV